jgi:hypothetical protein
MTFCLWATTSEARCRGSFVNAGLLVVCACRYANETAELISKLLEEIVLELAAVKNSDMALHLAVAMLQVRMEQALRHCDFL